MSFTAYCKVPRSFKSMSDFDNNTPSYIFLYSNSKYEIILRIKSYGSDAIQVYTISSGNYKFVKSNLTLNDTYNRYNIRFIYKDGYLIAEKAFIGFKEFAFEEIKLTEYSDFKSNSEEKPNALLSARSDYQKKNKILYDLKFGEYIGVGFYYFSLIINSNQSFELRAKGIKLLSGTWERKGNELRLFDTTLKHTFYVFIAQNKLINYVFNELIGSEFIIEKTKEKAKTKKKSKK